MSSTLGVQRWFRNSADLAASASELSRHAREFGFTFVGDDDDFVKKECVPLPPVPPLIPLGQAATAGRLKQVTSASDIECDDSAGSSEEPRRYGGVIMVNRGGASDDEEKLLRLFGGGDSDSNSVGVEVSGAGVCSGASEGGRAYGDGECAVVLDPLPTELLRSLSSRGRVSAERASVQVGCTVESAAAAASAGAGSGPGGPASVEVRGLLQDLVSEVATREERCEHELRRSPRAPRQEPQAGASPPSPTAAATPYGANAPAPPPPRIDAASESRDDDGESFGGVVGEAPRKTRHRKSESPRKAVRRRRERLSSSSGVGGGGAPSKKRRKRSTSTCSTTSSTCSNSSARQQHHHHRHHHKHHKHRRRGGSSPAPAPAPAEDEPHPTPRVNPIFVWIKQDNTRIVEVLCEDYDKRNRIRLTRTAHGWRAVPRTERLASATATAAATASASFTSTSSTVTSGDLRPRPGPAQEAVAADSPSEVALAPTSSTTDNRVEALADEPEEQCNIYREDSSTVDQNNTTSLVPTTNFDCPATNEEIVNEEGTKERDVEEVEEVEDVERDTPVKEIMEGDSVRYDGEEQTSELMEDSAEVPQELEEMDEQEVEEEDIVEKEDEEDSVEKEEEEDSVEKEEEEERPSFPEISLEDDASNTHENVVDGEEVVQKEFEEDDDSTDEKESHMVDETEPMNSEDAEHESLEPESLVMDSDEGKCSSPVECDQMEENYEPQITDIEAGDAVIDDGGDVDHFAGDEEEYDDEVDDDILAPTDLSLPKVHNNEQEIPINCKNIPRNISTVIPPVVPSPQPRVCPAYPPVTPAHQSKPHHSSKFLESLLSSPRKCHELPKRTNAEADKGPAPLDLGVSSANRGAGSPTVSCSDESRKVTRTPKEPAEGEPKAKSLKIEDITLKNLLSREPDTNQNPAELDLSSAAKKDDVVESGRKSRLLELLTSEPSPASVSPSPVLDPLAQLKKVLTDPDITVPDPLLVPRDRLQELVSNPAKEIPRLLTCRPELRLPDALAYPTLLRDPDLLVVSLSHLQSLLQRSEKCEKPVKENDSVQCNNLGNLLEYQMHSNQHQAAAVAKELFDAQLKLHQQQEQQHQLQKQQQQQQRHQEQQRQHQQQLQHQHQQLQQQQQQQQQQQAHDLDTANALNQMLWLPYLNQLEAVAAACGNTQEFLSILNTVFPPNYPQPETLIPPPPPTHVYGGINPAFNVLPSDFKSQMEIQNAIMLWHSAVTQARNANALNNNNNTTTSNNNHRSSKSPASNASKNFSSSNSRHSSQNSRKYNSSSAARTSPLAPNNHHSPSPVPSPQLRGSNSHSQSAAATAAYLAAVSGNAGINAVGNTGYPTSNQLHQQYNVQRSRHPTSGTTLSIPKVPSNSSKALKEMKVSNGQMNVSCKTLFNLLENPQVHQDVPTQSHLQPLLSTQSSVQKQLSTQQQQHAHLLAALGKPSSNNNPARNSPGVPQLSPLPPSPLDLSGATKKAPTPKLKVKEHLVDPAHTPKLLKADPTPEVTPPHVPLWHPLFGSQKTSLNSPWNWTTVTVNGE